MPIPVLVHLSLLTLMLVFGVTAAIIARKRSGDWLCRHRCFGVFGAAFGLIGITVMVAEKIEHGYPHFHSLHSLIGLSVGICLLLVPLLGFLGSHGRNNLRKPHRILARTLLILAVLALCSGVFRYLQLYKPTASTASVNPTPPSATR